MSERSDDQLHIEQLEVRARVGVSKRERAKSQRLALNITIWPERQASDDDIQTAVDYSRLCREATKFVTQRHDRLIETLADAVARHLLQKFAIRKIAIELRKFVLSRADYVSVTVNRGSRARLRDKRL
jgi:dihydroneopterin aldolase